MQTIWKLVLIGSVLLNLVAVWGFFHYIKYGGSPLGELKRKLTGRTSQPAPTIPYAEANAELIRQMESGDRVRPQVVFFGASITRRWDLETAFPGVDILNRGVGGQLVPSMLSRFKRDVLDIKPRSVIIKFCSINIRPQMSLTVLQDAMTVMSQLAQAHDIIPIPATMIPAGKPEAHIGDYNVAYNLEQFNHWVREYAQQENLALIDFAQAIADDDGFLPRDCSVDPVHVNEKGYTILTGAARPVIDSVLGLE